VAVLKAGKSRGGSKAAQSHTGSLAGSYEIYKVEERWKNFLMLPKPLRCMRGLGGE